MYPKDAQSYNKEACSTNKHSSVVCDSQNLESTQMTLQRRMNGAMWYIYEKEYYSPEKNKILKFSGKSKELEFLHILSEVTQ